MKIVLFGAVGLVVGLVAGTGIGAVKEKGVLTEELLARKDSIAAAAAHADTSSVALGEIQPASHTAEVAEAQPDAEGEAIPVQVDAAEHAEDEAEHPVQSADDDSEAVSDAGEVPEQGAAAGEVDSAGTDPGATSFSPVGGAPAQLGPGPSPADSILNQGPERLAKIFGAMKPKEAAAVLEQLNNAEVQSILQHISDRKAAAIISNFEPERAATLSRVVMGSGVGGE